MSHHHATREEAIGCITQQIVQEIGESIDDLRQEILESGFPYDVKDLDEILAGALVIVTAVQASRAGYNPTAYLRKQVELNENAAKVSNPRAGNASNN